MVTRNTVNNISTKNIFDMRTNEYCTNKKSDADNIALVELPVENGDFTPGNSILIEEELGDPRWY